MIGNALHICLVTSAYPPTIDGFATYTHDLAVSLVDLGQKVTVMCADYGDPSHSSDDESFEDRIRVIRLHPQLDIIESAVGGISGLSQLAWSLKVYKALRKYHCQTPFDIIEFTNWHAPGAIHSLRKIAPQVVRVTTSIRQITSRASTDSRERCCRRTAAEWLEELAVRKLNFFEALAVRRSDAIITPTRGHWCAVAPSYGFTPWDETKVVFIPFGTDVARASSPRKRADQGQCRLLFVGRLTQRKGFDVFMASLPEIIARARSEIHVTILGQDTWHEPAEVSMWQKYSGQLDDATRQQVEYLGPVSYMKREEAYQNCDVFVAPSRYESFGLIYIEAMCYGVPVVGCHVGGIPEVVEDGVTGLLVAPEDEAALANAVLRLADDPALRERLGRAAKESVIRRFNRERMALSTLEVYRDLVPRTRGGGCSITHRVET
jgi:glycogen(starch) synthase